MRSLGIVALASALAALPSCGKDDGASQDMATGTDLSVSSALDMSATNDDLSTLTGCHGLAACLAACKGDMGCQMTCRMSATMMGKKLARALNDCRQATCFAQDGGAAPCMMGTPMSAECMLCLKDADTAPGTCASSGTPSWCGACYQEFTACAADLP
jgi:hypothetical protein